MADNPPTGSPRIVCRLAYDDVEGAVDFISRAFGFTERPGARVTIPDGPVILTEIDVVDSYLMVGRTGSHGLQSPGSLGAATGAVIVYVDGIDAHFARARDAGAQIVSEPADQYWGDRRYEAQDPEGHLWSFHEHLRDVPREEMDAALQSLLAGPG